MRCPSQRRATEPTIHASLTGSHRHRLPVPGQETTEMPGPANAPVNIPPGS